jgi:hypothetical protein
VNPIVALSGHSGLTSCSAHTEFRRMKRILIGMVVGVVAGTIDVVPMILMKLTWDANLSAFSMWVIIGVLISTTSLNLPGMVKGAVLSLMVLCPSAILIGWKEPASLMPILLMTVVLGGISGFAISKIAK